VYTQLQSNTNRADAKEHEQQVLQHKTLVQRLERVVLVLDAALVEARLAREAMLLYIQVRGMELVYCYSDGAWVADCRQLASYLLAQCPHCMLVPIKLL
jgi:hypothetical protein